MYLVDGIDVENNSLRNKIYDPGTRSKCNEVNWEIKFLRYTYPTE